MLLSRAALSRFALVYRACLSSAKPPVLQARSYMAFKSRANAVVRTLTAHGIHVTTSSFERAV